MEALLGPLGTNLMRLWEGATLIFFVFLAIAAAASRPRPARVYELFAGVTAGLLLVCLVAAVPYYPILHDWVAPPIALLLAYWTSGLLFVRPRERQERVLMGFDRRLGILASARRMPWWLRTILELGYVGVYPLIPIALALHLLFAPEPDPDRFWSVVLITDYVCFAVLAWVQTRPPRALERDEPWTGAVRDFNLRMLGAASIQVNTFPSGHAAEGLAAALLVIGAPWPAVLWVFGAALAVSAGAVYGRYHYAADALAGWLVAVVVWVTLT
jgi:membrane-associated phospholipid phosphatase